MTTEIAKYETESSVPAATPLSPFGSIEGFVNCQRMAGALAASTFIPKAFQNNIGDCLILLETASRTNMPIMALMQNMYVVHGKPSFSSSFMAGLINNSNRFDGPLRFKYNDDRTACYAYATKDGEEYRGIEVSLEMAKKEGWMSKKGSKWQTMPEVMLQYRAISFFARAYCADLIMGMKSVDELQDTTAEVGRDVQDEDVTEAGNPVDLNDKFSSAGRKENGNGKPQVRTRPKVIAGFKEEIDRIDNSLHLDRWRMNHAKRIERELPKEDDRMQVHKHADARYKALKDAEAEARNEPPAPTDSERPEDLRLVQCPDSGEEVSVGYCNKNCAKREGCPAHE